MQLLCNFHNTLGGAVRTDSVDRFGLYWKFQYRLIVICVPQVQRLLNQSVGPRILVCVYV